MDSPSSTAAKTPSKGSPWLSRTTPGGGRRSLLYGTPTPTKRDSLVKVTFKQVHDRAPENSCMYITGSLPTLGSWDAKRARKMTADDESNSSWSLAFYIPEKSEFLYQYLLLEPPAEPDGEPTVLWEGALERKIKLEEAASTPNKAVLLRDDTRGEDSPRQSGLCATPPRVQRIAASELGPEETTEELREQVRVLETERVRAENELQKLHDIIGFAHDADAKYRERESFLPDAGALYDKIKEIQSLVRGKMLKEKVDDIDEAGKGAQDAAAATAAHAEAAQTQAEALAALRAELEATHAAEIDAMREQHTQELADCARELAEVSAGREEALSGHKEALGALREELAGAHGGEMRELKEYYEKVLGEMDEGQKAAAGDRAKHEEARAMLQGSVRVVAGAVQGIREDFGGLRAQAQDMLSELLPDMEEMRGMIAGKIEEVAEGLEEDARDSREKLAGETKERKRLHNLVQELRGNIRVFCRVRPSKEADRGKPAVSVTTESDLLLENGGKTVQFSYDKCFSPASCQEEVFDETQPLVVSVLDGYNVCIFAYGQTGSGKTHTMQGTAESPGVNIRALSALFDLAEHRRVTCTYTISVSLMEIYNETIRDLVDPKDAGGEAKKLDVKNSPDGGTHVPGLAITHVRSMADVIDVLRRGEGHRSVGATNMNEHSSRSHMVLSVYVQGETVGALAKTYGKMHLVDLAGSERITKSGAEGARLKEAQNINKSLSALGDCIQSLVAKSKHVPFRNSRLTFLLQDSLGGDSKALMFVCVAPGETDAAESMCSLNFAARVRNVELGPAKRKGDGGAEMRLRERERDLEEAREETRRALAEVEKLKAHESAATAQSAAAGTPTKAPLRSAKGGGGGE